MTEPTPSQPAFSIEKDDGVCFSAGHTGAPFGAGFIHAYLASDRKHPRVVAGISLGAVTAAVMERSYRDLFDSREEPARWRWYRRYLSFLLNRPYDVLWDAIPDPSDLLADLPPVRDPNLPIDEDGKAHKLAVKRDVESRRKLHIAATAGSWIVRLPVKVSSIAWLAVRYVRFREGYPKNKRIYLWNLVCLNANLLRTMWRLVLHSARPFFVAEWHFRIDKVQVRGKVWLRPLFSWIAWFRPLLGWRIWLACIALIGAVLADICLGFRDQLDSVSPNPYFHPVVLALLALGPVLPIYLWMLLRTIHSSTGERTARGFARIVMRNLDIENSFLSDFPLLLKLFRLFSENGASSQMSDCKFPVLLVAAPLQILPHSGAARNVGGPSQLWPRRGDLSMVRALRACLSISPLFEPWVLAQGQERDDRAHWLRDPEKVKRVDLVDGAAVRHNPLPALFEYLKGDRETAQALCAADARVHLVYDVPIRWKPEPPEVTADPASPEPQLPDIVGTALAGLQLARRRDSRLEVIRTNYISDVERHLHEATGAGTGMGVKTITVDEIAPEADLNVANNLKPTETEILTHIASGCRRTLQVLYQDELETETDCWEFLHRLAPKRRWDQIASPGVPGLPEVCRHCVRRLKPAEKPPENLLPPAFEGGSGRLASTFPALTGERPRVVFLASGGVFRGAFHIGMLGSMLALNLKPDLIIGASVGTLMGAMLGSVFRLKTLKGDDAARVRLNRLAQLFIDVDQRVALTKTFKAAAKDVGIRGRSFSLSLSPNEIRKMVKRGSRQDPGIAAAGAPPALIDAISDFFLIPYTATRNIAAEFVAGHFSKAISDFSKQISTETIERLGIRDAVLGATLVEKEIRELLKDDLQPGLSRPIDAMQPFLKDCGIAMFATTVNLVTESIITLGADLDCPSYDFLEALLASSAFPAAFAPRRASALYPGRGRRDIFYGDGGMFDNLPMLPALEVMSEMQKDHLRNSQAGWQAALKHRYENPDLFLVGSLNTKQEAAADREFGFVLESWKRAQKLSDNEKIFGVERAAQKVDRQLAKALAAAPREVPAKTENFLNGIVNAAILPVYPTDEEHLNGTFEFCPSLGLKAVKVRRSVADGCFQTMLELYRNQRCAKNDLLARGLAASRVVQLRPGKGIRTGGFCPYFQTTAGAIRCPFDDPDAKNGEKSGVHEACIADRTHKELAPTRPSA